MLKVVASYINTQLRTCNHVGCTRCNVVILMAATAWLMLSFSSCIVCGFDSYTVLFKWPQRKFLSPPRTRYRNWRTKSATQSSKLLCYIGYTSTWWQHDCWLTVQTHHAHIHTNARENNKDTCKTEGGLVFVAHSVQRRINEGRKKCNTGIFMVCWKKGKKIERPEPRLAQSFWVQLWGKDSNQHFWSYDRSQFFQSLLFLERD